MKATFTKKSPGMKALAPPSRKLTAKPEDFVIQDNGDDTLTFFPVDGAGNPMDASLAATLEISSDDPTVVTVDTPVGVTSAEHVPTNPPPSVGKSCNITAVLTLTDGSAGPFSITWKDTIGGSAAAGLNVQHGPVTIHTVP